MPDVFHAYFIGSPKIEKMELVRFNDTSVWVKEGRAVRRHLWKSENEGYFFMWMDAKDWLVYKVATKVQDLKLQMDFYEKQLTEAREMR